LPPATSAKRINPEIRPFQRRDLRRVVEIERASFGKDAWTPELFLEYWRACPELFFIAKDGRRIAGYSIARVDWRGAELESIAVEPPYRGRGIAQALLQTTISQLGAGTLRLMVSTANESALGFYQRFGFTRVRKVPGYYGSRRDAWRLRLKISRPN
jgi:[ribosomal protein S18]-alanine N-acetyltransferase